MNFNEIQVIKRKFYALRNGVTADALRKGGSPFKIIFGLNIIQLRTMAREIGVNNELGLKLWSNSSTRCSMLLAPMIMDPEKISREKAIEMCDDVSCYEVADILCKYLFSRVNFVDTLTDILLGKDDLRKYIALRLMMNGIKDPDEQRLNIVKNIFNESNDISLRFIAMQIIEKFEDEYGYKYN